MIYFGAFELLCILFVGACAYISFRRGQNSIDFEGLTMIILKELERDNIITIDPETGDIRPVQLNKL